MERICNICCNPVEGEDIYCHNCCSSSASSACLGADAQLADQASAVPPRLGDDVIRDEALMLWRGVQLGLDQWAAEVEVDGIKVRIEITRQE